MTHQLPSPRSKQRRFSSFSSKSSHHGWCTFSTLVVYITFSALLMYIFSDNEFSFRPGHLRVAPQGQVQLKSTVESASIPSNLILSKFNGRLRDQDFTDPAPADQYSDQDSVCNGRRIYIYQVPPEFNEDLTEDCESWVFKHWSMCDDVFNGGFGQQMNLSADPVASTLLQPPSAWYRTDQFSLEVLFHRRLTTYPCLTSDPNQASLFYLPFYHGLDLSRHIFNENFAVRDELSERFLTWLRKQPAWKLTGGHRHLLVLGRIIWDFHRSPGGRWGSALLENPEVGNLTTLQIEGSYNTVAIPYPTNFHPASDAELQSWQATVRGANRTHLLSFAGSSRGNPSTKKMRGALLDQCEKSSRCKLVRCTQAICGENAQTIYKLALESVFCLQPPGDSPTRKGIFDVLLSGCIPVLFHRNQAVEQYMWHLKGDGSEYSVLMDDSAVTSDNYDVVAHLERIPKAEVQRLQENIVRLLPLLLYRNPTLAGEYTSKDAFDVAIDGVLEKYNGPPWEKLLLRSVTNFFGF